MSNQKQKKILICGNSLNQAAGLSYVSSSLTQLFTEMGYNVSYVTISGAETTLEGMRVQGERFIKSVDGKLTIYNTISTEPKAFEKFNVLINNLRPDIVFSIHDPWWLDIIAFSEYRSTYTWIAYPTIEAKEYPEEVFFPSFITGEKRKNIRTILSQADAIIPCSEMGHTTLKNMGLTNVLSPIPEGLHTEDREEGHTKESVFGDLLTNNNFMFMTMGLNTDRKKIERVIIAFSIFLKKMQMSDKYKLYMHTDTERDTGGTDLKNLIRSLGIEKYVLIPNGLNGFAGLTRNELYKRYSVSDCYIGMPGGEGFGYGFAEAIMHGKPIIYGNYGAHAEFCSTCGIPVPISDYFYAKNAAIPFALINTEEAAKAMVRMVSDPKLREGLASKTEEVTKKFFNWSANAAALAKVMEEVDNKNTSSLKSINIRRII